MTIKNQEEINVTTQPEEMNVVSQIETESLDDLSVEDDEQVKGGPGGYNCSVCGIGLGNHNETTTSDEDEDEDDVESLADLPMKDDEQITGGHYVGSANGGVWKTTNGN
jgi:hypothetical protein